MIYELENFVYPERRNITTALRLTNPNGQSGLGSSLGKRPDSILLINKFLINISQAFIIMIKNSTDGKILKIRPGAQKSGRRVFLRALSLILTTLNPPLTTIP